MWMSAVIVLLGAELNAEIECRTASETARPDQPTPPGTGCPDATGKVKYAVPGVPKEH
jgi:hypothetical protein